MLFTLIFLVLVSLIGYELGYREGQTHAAPSSLDGKAARPQSSEAAAAPASESGEKSDRSGMQRP